MKKRHAFRPATLDHELEARVVLNGATVAAVTAEHHALSEAAARERHALRHERNDAAKDARADERAALIHHKATTPPKMMVTGVSSATLHYTTSNSLAVGSGAGAAPRLSNPKLQVGTPFGLGNGNGIFPRRGVSGSVAMGFTSVTGGSRTTSVTTATTGTVATGGTTSNNSFVSVVGNPFATISAGNLVSSSTVSSSTTGTGTTININAGATGTPTIGFTTVTSGTNNTMVTI